MELDGYAVSLGLAFEYHGRQHYERVSFFHRDAKAFEKRQQDDDRKRRLCESHGITLLEIPHHVPESELHGFLVNQLRKVKPQLVRDDTPAAISTLNVWRRGIIEQLRAIAKSHKGRLLSDFYINNSTNLRWRCAEGHEWEATSASVKRGSWCKICGYARVAERRSKTIEDMQALAAAKGGVCLSKTYVGGRSKLKWRCAEGHVWMTLGRIVAGGHWCRTCQSLRWGRVYALTLEDMQKTAKARGGECLSRTYLNARKKLHWRCGKGHEWQAIANSIRSGSWCPTCAGKRPKSRR